MILRQLLGEIMIYMGFLTGQQVEEALQRQRKIFEEKMLPERLQRIQLVSEARLAKDRIPLLGKILIDMGFATKEQLEGALKEQQKMVEAYKPLESEKLGTAIEISSIVNSTLDLAEILALIMRHANQLTNSIAGTLMLLDEETGELVFGVPTGPKADKLTDIRIPSGKGIAGWVAEHEQPALVTNAREDPRFYPEIDTISGLETKSILCVPLKAKTKLIGVLEVINKADGTSFTQGDELLLSVFAHQAAMGIENARLYSELKNQLEKEMQIQKKLGEDVRQRKRVEEALHREKEKFRVLVEESPLGVSLIEKDGHCKYINPKFVEMFGYTLEDIPTGQEWFEKAYPDKEYRHQVISTWITDIKNSKRGESRPRTFNVTCKDGFEKVIHFWPVTMETGEQFVICEDITEGQRAEEALRESEEKYRTILESIEEGYFEVDLAGNFTFFNDSLCKISGLPRNELMGMNNREYTTPETAKRMYQVFNKIYRTGKPARVMDHEIITKDGRTIPLEMSASLMLDSAGEPIGFRGVVRDVTERKRAEEEKEKLEAQLLQAQKMEAIGTISSGIAHNFRNILTVISMNSQVLQHRYEDDPTLQGIADILNSYVERGSQLVDRLMVFSRKQTKKEFQPLNLTSVVRETYELIRKSFDKMIHVSVDIPESLPIMGDHSGLTHVLMNLCTNASDAMPDGGELHIEASRKRDKALVVISDTGHGMDKETREKCFDPFFTTKELDKGTGLGLSTSYGIVKEHGGQIRVYSEIGQGTTFKLFFPLDLSGDLGRQEPSDETSRGKGQRILVVDDETAVCKAMEELLEGFGYHVAYVSSGKAAILKYKSWQPDAVLLDRNMPEMDGISCAEKIMDYDPNAKIVIISGYDEHGPLAIDEQRKRLIKAYLTKPIDMTELSTLLARVLEQ